MHNASGATEIDDFLTSSMSEASSTGELQYAAKTYGLAFGIWEMRASGSQLLTIIRE